MKIKLLLLLTLVSYISFSQKTKVEGVVTDSDSGEPLAFVKVRFQDSKIGIYTDTAGYYVLETYYATDSLIFSAPGYLRATYFVQKDAIQSINVSLTVPTSDFEEVVIRPPDEFPSTILHKKVIANKPINNKEKLNSYEYEVYNKVQIDLNNIGEKFQERGVVKRLDLVMNYLDSADNGKNFLPMLLSENVSDFYFKNHPKKKKEVVKASRISGIENVQLNQFLGDMYLDVNVYDNTISLFNKSFISPVANYARNFYRFYLEDSSLIDNQWCYKLTFKPKREGDMTFIGEMWIHDTTYAVKQFKANIAPWTNINYVQDLYIEHSFDLVAPEVWMLTEEKMITDLKITKKSDIYGFYGRRNSTRRNFVINSPHESEFYKANSTVETLDGANSRSDEFWAEIRHEPLTEKEVGIDQMVDSLKNLRFFKVMKNTIYLASTGYIPLKKIELGSAYSLASINPVEGFRTSLALRTSNSFSRRLELGGRIAYGFKDARFKYGASVRYNITPKKRGMLTGFYNYDIEQIGQSSTAASVGSTFGTLLRTGPLDKLTFVEKAGINLEKDIKKDVILFGGIEWKEYTALGVANYLKPNLETGIHDTISSIRTSEITFRYRWAKDEEFISGAFDRKSIRSKYPIIAIQGIIGVKGLLGANYNYQKFDLFLEHQRNIGFLGRIKYNINAGCIFGSAAYPFLKVHEGNQSYWLYTNAFNKMNFFEFISDRYVTGLIENHWDGLFFDRIPGVRKLKLRLVTTARIAYGSIDQRHEAEMILPTFTKHFGSIPYIEVAAGIENILKLARVDVFWRLTHLEPGIKTNDISNFGIRARYSFNF
ncbi:MAG: DUF5686 and carboxypeptidase regulatory-like domain-containing protein [Crocinitomicaceae bacterium]|nr:DUF5686 and carboxypeptidase regulatory-like domain-containing protein [Crocinitomicaceae bacterium]